MTTTLLRPAVWDLYPYRGDALTITLRFPDTSQPNSYAVDTVTGAVTMLIARDVTGWDVRAQVRAYPNATDPPLATFTVDTSQQAGGIIKIALTGTQMSALPARDLSWDCQRTSPAVRTLFAGIFGVGADTTR